MTRQPGDLLYNYGKGQQRSFRVRNKLDKRNPQHHLRDLMAQGPKKLQTRRKMCQMRKMWKRLHKLNKKVNGYFTMKSHHVSSRTIAQGYLRSLDLPTMVGDQASGKKMVCCSGPGFGGSFRSVVLAI